MLEQIQKFRYKKSYPWDETDLGVKFLQDYFLVSCTFWNFLVDHYGCDYTIELHKYLCKTSMHPKYVENDYYATYETPPALAAHGAPALILKY